ncbi:MAG: adenosine deaminase [Actinomycetota bacterium]|nr:adenosine deaminase [Actinomycetota bacterium]
MYATSSPTPELDVFVSLTKADLHLHLVGSASPHTVASLAAAHPDGGVPTDLDELRAFYAFSGFAHFLAVYTAISNLLRTPEDIVTLVVGLGEDLARQGTAYAEVTVTPFSHRRAGIAPDELAAALEVGARRARDDRGVEVAYVYDISAADGEPGAAFTLEAALRHPPAGLVGFGLGGPEEGVRRADFAPYFAAARAAGLHSVPHAGESVGPSEIYAALDLLGAERIGHGIAAASDEELLARLADDGVTLEVCPSSNVATGIVRSLGEHPLARLLEAGVPVVLCSDDPPMFATTLPEEYRRARDEVGLSEEALQALARRSIEASFAPVELKRRLLEARGAGASQEGTDTSRS